MSGHIWEQAVAIYLAIDRGVFLNPQYLIGEPNGWNASADYLALDFPKGQAWMVEVSKAPSRKIFAKISQFNSEYSPRISAQLQHYRVIKSQNSGDEWTIGLWLFVPGATLSNLKDRMDAAGIKPAIVTALEDTLASSAWNARFH